MIITVRKIDGSAAVVIPPDVAREMELVEGTPLDINVSRDAIVLRHPHRRPRRPLKDIVGRIDPAGYRRHRLNAEPMGKEVW